MKKLFVLTALIAYGLAYGQGGAGEGNFTGPAVETGTNFNAAGFSKIVGVNYEFDDIRFADVATDGSYFLFDEWENEGVIITGDKKYVISNINFFLLEEQFMSKMDTDSLFIYDFKGIDKIYVNGRQFISKYDNNKGKNSVYEIVYLGDEGSLVKNYSVTVIESSNNPMLNRSRRKIKTKANYSLLRNGGLIPIKLKKSDILKLVEVSKRDAIEEYAKKKGLSFKKEDDVSKILDKIKSL